MTDLTGANLPSSFLSLQALGALSLLEPLSYTATDAISSLFSITVECAIPDTRLQTMVDMQESMLYQPITLITSPAQDNTTQYYNGLVTGIEISVDKTTCTLTIEPALSLLKQSRRNRIFLNKTPFEIVHQILQETILTAYPNFTWDDKNSAIQTIALNTKNDMTMQYQESDLAFISRLLHQIGVYFYISCDKNSHTIHLVSRVSQLKTLPSIVLCDAHTQRKNTSMINWQSITKTCADTVIVNTYDPNQANANLNSGQANESNLAVLTFPSTHTTLEQAAIIAQNQKNALQSQSDYFTGETGRLDITVGMLVRIDRSQNASANDSPNDSTNVSTYLITSIKTNAEAQGLNTYHCQFSAVDAYASDYQPVCVYQKPKIFSLQTATVITQGAEPVMVSAGLQVKVRFMWEDDNARAENCAWIRVMQASAGNNWGMVWVPRVDDEVLVSFENGDIDHPVIIGSAYNSVKMPAFDVADQYATTAIKMASISKDATDSTRSNELIFNNEMNQECITIKAQRDFTQVIANDALTVVQGISQTKVLQGDMTMDVEEGALVAQASESITLQVGGTQIVLKPSGISVVATVIHLNPSSSGSPTPANLDAKVSDVTLQKTKTYGAIQNDIISSDPPPAPTSNNPLKNKLEVGALAASMVAAVPFDVTGAGEAEQAAAGAEIASLEVEDVGVAEEAESSSLQTLFKNGRTPKASEIKIFAENRGWSPRQSDNGPLKYFDKNGKERIAIKKGSARTPGSEEPHVALRDENGERIDPFGNKVTKKGNENHTPIDYDI